LPGTLLLPKLLALSTRTTDLLMTTLRTARILAAVAPLALSCQSIPMASRDAPRVELEVEVRIDDSYAQQLADLDDAFRREVEATVLAQADLGLRFYPVLSTDYAADDARPTYLMTVDIGDLTLRLDHAMKPVEGAEPVVETYVRSIDCRVSVTLVKRRDSGPALTVGRGEGGGLRSAARHAEAATGPGYTVRGQAEGQPELPLARSDLLQSIGWALGRALPELVRPADREFAAVTAPHAKARTSR